MFPIHWIVERLNYLLLNSKTADLILYKMDIFFSFFQVDALRWRALAQQAKDESQCIHFKVLFEALKGLEKQWDKDLLSCEEVGNIQTSCSF